MKSFIPDLHMMMTDAGPVQLPAPDPDHDKHTCPVCQQYQALWDDGRDKELHAKPKPRPTNPTLSDLPTADTFEPLDQNRKVVTK